jgi:hypothetical protein
MSLRIAVVLAALVVCANAQWLNFGTYAEDFEPAPGFVLTTLNDNTNLLRGGRAGLLQSSTVIVVKIGAGVHNLREGATVYPALQRAINSEGAIVNPEVGVDTRAYCPQPIDLNPPLIGQDAFLGAANPAGFVPNPIWQIEDPLADSTSIRGNYCIYHESQIAAVINNQAVQGSAGSSQIFNGFGFPTFFANLPGTTRPTL